MRTPLWLDGHQPHHAPLSGTAEAEVLVIGAGLCGAAAAYGLAQAGVPTVWAEAGMVSVGASGRNAGFILQGTAERYARAIAIMGRERTREVHRLSLANHAAMAQTVATLGLSCGYQKRGSLQLAESEHEEADLLESAALLRADGFAAEIRHKEQLAPWCAEGGFSLGVYLPEDGELDPAAFVRGVADAAVARGVQLFEQTPVLELDAAAPGSVVARTPTGEIRASIALICTNAASGRLIPWFADKIEPVRGQMLATAPAPQVFECPVYADHGFDYWRQDEHGRVVLGGWRNLDPQAERGEEEVLHSDIQARMTDFIRRFSALRDVPITHRWSGTMGFSRDSLPIVGPVPGYPGALAAAGFTGHGFGFAWMCGSALVDIVLQGSSPVATLLSSRRFL